MSFGYSIPAMITFVTFILYNNIYYRIQFVSISAIKGTPTLWDDSSSLVGKKLLAFGAFTLLFGAIVSSILIYALGYSRNPNVEAYPGVALILQSLLSGISALLFKFGKTNYDDFV